MLIIIGRGGEGNETDFDFNFNEYFKNYVYELIDLCSCYEPIATPPSEFWDEPQNPFYDTIERKIGSTCYIVKTECEERELLADKVKRLIFLGEKGKFLMTNTRGHT